MQLGFIGQGFIGKSYADDFESRGYTVIRYTNEAPYSQNKDAISKCDIVFIAVPTPTTPEGFDYSIVEEVLNHVGENSVAVIKSTLLPGTTDSLQEKFPSIFIMHSPEFLVAKTAAHDAKNPTRNIIGYTTRSMPKAEMVLSVLPPAPYSKILPVKDAEMIKYMGNILLTQKVVFANVFHDLCEKVGADYQAVQDAVGRDSRITPSHLQVNHDAGRGAGGFCFIKDLAAFSKFYKDMLPEHVAGHELLTSLEKKNIELLLSTKKDLDLLHGVYGDDIVTRQ